MAAQRHQAIPFSRRSQAPTSRTTARPLNTKRQHSSGALPSHKSPSKGSGQDLRGAGEDTESLDEDMMAASFPNFCTFCENQISVPSPSILYCSESCRKKDQNKELSYSNLMSDVSPTFVSPSTFSPHHHMIDLPTRDIIPQRSPTALNRNRFSSHSSHSISEMSSEDQYSEDEGSYAHERRRPTVSRKGSEADHYLRQFRAKNSPDVVADCTSSTPKPRYNRSSSSFMTGTTPSGMPGLSHSPSFSSDAMGLSLPYTPSTRPLPPRSNPFSSSYGPKSTDLVNPFAILPVATTSMSLQGYTIAGPRDRGQSHDDVSYQDGMRYEKRGITNGASRPEAAGSLKQLFRFNEMQAAPDQQYEKY